MTRRAGLVQFGWNVNIFQDDQLWFTKIFAIARLHPGFLKLLYNMATIYHATGKLCDSLADTLIFLVKEHPLV